MRKLRLALFASAMVLTLAAATAKAQVGVGIGIGPRLWKRLRIMSAGLRVGLLLVLSLWVRALRLLRPAMV